jgi:hypothetical protein
MVKGHLIFFLLGHELERTPNGALTYNFLLNAMQNIFADINCGLMCPER